MFAVLMLWFAHPALEIVGPGECPAPAVVSQKLVSLMPAAPDGATSAGPTASLAPSPGVHLSETPAGELEVLLLGADGRPVDVRRLKSAGCDALAAAVAVIVATWAAEPALVAPERVDLPAPAAPAPAREAAPPAVVAAAPSVSAVSLPLSSASNLRVGAMASSAGAEWAAGLQVAGGTILWDDRWGLDAVVAATGSRSQPVGSVSEAARWRRDYLGLGPEVTVLPGRITLKAHVQALLGLLRVTGNGLEMTASDTSLRFGSTAGIWAAWRGWRGVWPWIGADLLFWPGRERLRVEGVATDGTVPALEGQVAAGIGIGLFP